MIALEPLLVTLVKLIDSIPVPPPPDKRPRGRPKVYSDRLFSRRWPQANKGGRVARQI